MFPVSRGWQSTSCHHGVDDLEDFWLDLDAGSGECLAQVLLEESLQCFLGFPGLNHAEPAVGRSGVMREHARDLARAVGRDVVEHLLILTWVTPEPSNRRPMAMGSSLPGWAWRTHAPSLDLGG